MERTNNYIIQAQQAKERFLTYDQEEIIRRLQLDADDNYLYLPMLSRRHRICRETGHMEKLTKEGWADANSFGEVMTLLDLVCDSRPDRYITGRWVNIVTQGHCFHRNLQEDGSDPNAELFDREPDAFRRACLALGGEEQPGADIGYAIELVDGLKILVQLWHGDEEFPPRLRCLWDENALRYIRYETTWYAVGLLMEKIKGKMKNPLG